MINTTGIITTIAGGGDSTLSFSGDGGLATAASLLNPSGIAFDAVGDLYIADASNNRIRKINSVGIINTVVGNGTNNGYSTGGYSGDGGLAINAQLFSPTAINFDTKGNLYIADALNNEIRKVTPPLNITVNSDTICAGNTTTLIANGANTYIWSPSVGLNTTFGAVVIASPSVTTTYTITGNKGDSMGLTLATVTIPALVIDSQVICLGVTTTLSAAFATTCTWSTGETTPTITVTPTTTTTYSVTGLASTCGVMQTAVTTVTVNGVPSANLSNAYTDSTGCGLSNGAVYGISTNNISGGTPPYHFQWYSAGNAIVGYAADTLSNVPAGLYTIQITDTNGCAANIIGGTSVYQIPGLATPTVNFTITQDPMPHVWDLYVTYSADVTNATWRWGDSTFTTGMYTGHSYDTSGNYNICVTVYNLCGDSSTFCLSDSLYRFSHNNIVSVNIIATIAGVSSNIQNASCKIYPNPSNGSFFIETNSTEKQTMKLFDVGGKLILTQTINDKTTIDVSNLNDGVYNLSVTNKDGVTNKKLIIIK